MQWIGQRTNQLRLLFTVPWMTKYNADYKIYYSHFHRPSHAHYMHRHTQQIVCLHISCRCFFVVIVVVSACNICLSIYNLHVSFRLWSVYYILKFCSCPPTFLISDNPENDAVHFSLYHIGTRQFPQIAINYIIAVYILHITFEANFL